MNPSYSFCLLGLLMTLSGCVMASPDPINTNRSFVKAAPVTSPHTSSVGVAKPLRGASFVYGDNPALRKAYRHYLTTGKAPNIITQGFLQVAYNLGQQPIVNTSPFEETVISLQPGEHFTNVSSGDPSRWSYDVAESGQGSQKQQHVLVKPSAGNISTNLVITTDKHLYNVRLVATTDAALTRHVSFWYPDEMVEKAKAAAEVANQKAEQTVLSGVEMTHLNFNYHLSNGGFFHSPVWKPLRVFDDGRQTVIQFSPLVQNRELPALFIFQGGVLDVVNYRYQAPYMVIDRIFPEAVLMSGVGTQATRLMIQNLAYRQ